jgi:hypothetical protein
MCTFSSLISELSNLHPVNLGLPAKSAPTNQTHLVLSTLRCTLHMPGITCDAYLSPVTLTSHYILHLHNANVHIIKTCHSSHVNVGEC